MRHKVYGKHLSRTRNQRTALFKSLVQSLVLSESIQTTESKAKAIKGLMDKIITQAKNPSTKRLVTQFLTNKKVSDKLFNDITPRLQSRNSGYTSVVRLGNRLGDNAMMVKMSLLVEGEAKSAKTSAKKAEVKNEQNVSVEAPAPEKETKTTTKKAAPKKTAKATKKEETK